MTQQDDARARRAYQQGQADAWEEAEQELPPFHGVCPLGSGSPATSPVHLAVSEYGAALKRVRPELARAAHEARADQRDEVALEKQERSWLLRELAERGQERAGRGRLVRILGERRDRQYEEDVQRQLHERAAQSVEQWWRAAQAAAAVDAELAAVRSWLDDWVSACAAVRRRPSARAPARRLPAAVGAGLPQRPGLRRRGLPEPPAPGPGSHSSTSPAPASATAGRGRTPSRRT